MNNVPRMAERVALCSANANPFGCKCQAIKHITWLKSANKAKSETMKSMAKRAVDDDTDIEVDYDEVSAEQRNNSIAAASEVSTSEAHVEEVASQCDILAKPAFTSRLLQNIPVRPRKGIPHLDNYCLFDPSKDFVNEKELKRKQKLLNVGDQLMNEKVYEKLDDIAEETECGNYVVVDPETPSPDAAIALNSTNESGGVAHGPTFVRINKTASVNNFMSIGGNRPAAPKTATKIEKLFRQSSLPTVVSHRATESSLQRGIVAKQLPPKHLPLRTNNGNGVTPHAMANAGASDALKHSVSSPQLNYAKDRRNKFHAPSEPIYMLYNSTHSMGNRSVQTAVAAAKKRYGRPLSSHSDADSGFLSPVTPCETTVAMQQHHPSASSSSSTQSQHCDNFEGYITVSSSRKGRCRRHGRLEGGGVCSEFIIFLFVVGLVVIRWNVQIYMDWANNYLERAKSKKRVNDLSNDCRDGVLLADIIEAVTACKVPDLNKKPKNHSQMVSDSWQHWRTTSQRSRRRWLSFHSFLFASYIYWKCLTNAEQLFRCM